MGQDVKIKIEQLEAQKSSLKSQLVEIEQQLEGYELEQCLEDLIAIGLPSEDYITHSAMILSYSEEHEQAAWVSHIILPKIESGTAFRSNDFRTDPKILSGTAVEEDYFLKYAQADGSYEYDGFGYDRGHLAPSADFRWSTKALSESYYYSNMSPQVDEFNREIWADLEASLRSYVITHRVPLYVVTLPVLEDDLPSITRSINKVSIPRKYIKVALDAANNQAIAFSLENKKADRLLPAYAITVDKAEELTGLDFFSKYNNPQVEAQYNAELWFPELADGDKEPIYAPSLPRGHFNTLNAALHAKSGRKITVCGHTVGTRYSKKGHLWLNLDKQFPNQIFSVFVRKEDLVNFSGDLEQLVKNDDYCFTGKVESFNGTPTMNVEDEKQVKAYLRIGLME
jgi:endonuclease G